MSLKVWLPLNGDNKNQGLLDITPTNLGTISYLNDGKIGKCLSAGKGTQTSNGISYNNNLVNILGTQFSCSIWVRPLGNHVHYNGTFISSGNWNGKCWAFGVSQDNTKVDIFSKSYNRYIDCVVPVNQWTHLVCTSDNGLVKLYKNGEYVGQSTQSTTLDSDAANFCVGRETYASGYFSFNGNINDIRIYDHCLSIKEIKEISKGLVCHYKLDNDARGGQENLYDFQSIASKWTADGATRTDYLDSVYGNVLKINSSSGSKRIYRGVSNIWTSGQKYTVSFLAKADSNCICDMSRSIVDFSPQFNLSTEWKRYSGQINCTATVDGGTLSFRVLTTGINVYITQVKLEKGENATVYCPNKQDPDYNKLGYNNTTIYDSSGYNHHGTRMTDTLSCSTDTARNSLSTNFNGTDDGILIENLDLSPIINNSATYSFWIKPNGENGARSVYFGMYSGTSWSIEKGTGNILRSYWAGSPDEYCSGASVTDGIWQHICIVKDGVNSIKVYINGVLKWTSTATHSNKTFSTTCRIGRDTRSGDGTPYKGLMSDFRIYATALSEDDVKELYQTSASIDKNGNMFAYEFKED